MNYKALGTTPLIELALEEDKNACKELSMRYSKGTAILRKDRKLADFWEKKSHGEEPTEDEQMLALTKGGYLKETSIEKLYQMAERDSVLALYELSRRGDGNESEQYIYQARKIIRNELSQPENGMKIDEPKESHIEEKSLPSTTPRTQPADDERKLLYKKLKEDSKQNYLLSNELSDLQVVKEPQEPKLELKENINGTIALTALCVIVFFIFHCIIWVLKHVTNISWDTWGWTVTVFWVGLAAVPVVAVLSYLWHIIACHIYDKNQEKYDYYINTKNRLTKEIKETKHNIEKTKKAIVDSLTTDVKDLIEVPLSPTTIGLQDKEMVENLIHDYYSLKQQMKSESNISEKQKRSIELANKKLSVFYLLSIRGESTSIYPIFKDQLLKAQKEEDYNLLRVETKNNLIASYLGKIDEYTALLQNNKMTPIMERLDIIKNRDTSGWLFNTDTTKLLEKTNDLQELCKAANEEYQEITNINKKIDPLLEYVRICAFRNIYLGAELLNYIRDNAGGKSLTTEKDNLKMEEFVTNNYVDTDELKLNIVNSITSAWNNSINKITDALLADRESMKFAFKNPKAAGGIAAGYMALDFVLNYFDERNSKIDQNIEIQEEMINNMQKMIDSYTHGQGSLLRALEIIKAISKANSGFMQIYEPLRKCVFEENNVSAITMHDIRQLAIATNEYNKISKSKL